jgi:NADPH-dependent 2,4-dienoyl-CoA reductase/sulfur reductase-like enzyme
MLEVTHDEPRKREIAMKFLVIGGDAAGMSAASRAKRRQPELDVTVLEKSQDVSYSACGMPYNIAVPDKEIEALVVRTAQVFRDKQGIDVKTGHLAQAIDAARQLVSGTTSEGISFEAAYDR